MGTNYYAELTPPCPTCKKQDEADQIHIGKSSMGWAFIFNYNKGFFYKNVKELRAWLEDFPIVDEYDEKIKQEDFWALVEAKQDRIDHNIEQDSLRGSWDAPAMFIDGYCFYDSNFS